jgi:hypothetical protein
LYVTMNDDTLQQLLKDADALHQAARRSAVSASVPATMIAAIYRRRTRKLRQRRRLGILAVLIIVGGLSAWTLSTSERSGAPRVAGTKASNTAKETGAVELPTTSNEPPQERRLRPEEIARLKLEIAALDAEANRARRLVDLHRAADARRERLAALEAAAAEPVLPPDMLAELGIDRAAAITVTAADAQANEFNEPEEAARSYRSVLTHFPSSRWANIAQERLAEIQHMN